MVRRLALLTQLLVLAACAGPPAGEPVADAAALDDRLVVRSVNYPLHYFAARIGGERVRAELPVPADVDPADWVPAAEAVGRYQEADLILLNGAGYAGWVERVTLPESKLVDTSASFADRYVEIDDTVVHSHGPEGEHSHGTWSYTTWLDPRLAAEQARAVADALVRTRPADATGFRERQAQLEQELGELDRRLEQALEGRSTPPLLASHPVYGYLARRYGLDLRSVHFEPGAFPDGAGWAELEALLAERPSRLMLWEAAPLPQTAERLAASGVEVAVFDPCGNVPERGDLLSVMRANVDALIAALGSEPRAAR